MISKKLLFEDSMKIVNRDKKLGNSDDLKKGQKVPPPPPPPKKPKSGSEKPK